MTDKPSGCSTCIGLTWSKQEFIPPSGSGENGVLILGEAGGEHEAQESMGFVGKAGMYLFQNLQRVGIDREGFRIDNVVHCRPPKNFLAGSTYELEVINQCDGYLRSTIEDMKAKCRENGKTFVILTLGKVAFKTVMDLTDKHPILHKDYIAYPFWSTKFSCWCIPAYHPSYLMRGNTHLVPILQFAATRALEIANGGFKFAEPRYELDPNATQFQSWIRAYKAALSLDPALILSYDIETPMKQGNDEEKVSKEEDDDYTILRCSFSYKVGEGCSVVWDAEHKAGLEELFACEGPKCGWNNFGYDRPRILAQMPINGVDYDGMLMWHVLNSSLPKGLGFVAPFYAQHQGVWKWTSDKEPALYNSIDSDVTLQCVLGIMKGLKDNNLWDVFDRHVTEVHKVFNYMSAQGVLVDQDLRLKAEGMLATTLEGIEARMETSVPKEARKFKLYKKKPKVVKDDMFTVIKEFPVKYCSLCAVMKPTKTHSKVCPGFTIVELLEPMEIWAEPLKFKVSKLGLTNYQSALKHQAVISRKEGKTTFDEKAIIQLIKKHPKDPLYPLILEHRGTQKLLSNYIGVTQPNGRVKGGIPVGKDGRVRCTFTSNPSTLRSACQQPNLQNQVRPKGPDDPATIVRNLFIASPGTILGARDFSGIEAKLVGYFAGDPDYMRLCSIDVHSYYTAYAINALDGRIKTYDLPQLSWDDARLSDYLANIKREFKRDRNNLYKHLVHAANFGQKERGAQEKILLETGIAYPVATIKRVMDVYYDLFPKIKKWQWNSLLQVEKEGFLRNPFGYVHRFNRPFDYEKIGNQWQKSQGIDANKIYAFLPQSTAAGVIKEAMLRLYQDRFEEAGQYLRLLIHDELFWEVPIDLFEEVDRIVAQEMERPITQMPLPASYGLGPYLTIGTEGKKGYSWGSMK